MSDPTFAVWVFTIGQIMTLLIMIWNKWEQRRQGQTLAKTYALTNSAFGTLAAVGQVAAERLAQRTGEEGDAVLAAAAKKVLEEHAAKQAAVDAKEGKPPSP